VPTDPPKFAQPRAVVQGLPTERAVTAPHDSKGTSTQRCRCGAAYDHDSWLRLKSIGVQRFEDEVALELRHCATCSNTITKPLPK
jgi:hypothetical protein